MELGIATVAIGVIAYLIAKITNRLIIDPRPFIVSGHPALISSSTDNGFPSDHTLLLGVVAAVVTIANWRVGLVFWALALLVGLARVYAGVHHLADIVGSLVIVGLAAGLYLLGRELWSRYRARSAEHASPPA